jgi:hypothetical protein
MKTRATIILLLAFSGASLAQPNLELLEWGYTISMLYSDFQFRHLNFGDFAEMKWGGWQRNSGHNKPGDYFCLPEAIPRTIADSTRSNIYQSYSNLIISRPDSALFNKLDWYSDTLTYKWLDLTEIRNEYFLRYTDQRFVYVISGWWPNFIKFYKAFPTNENIGIDSLLKEANLILKSHIKIPKTAFSEVSDERYFLIQGKSDDLMVRYYNIKAYLASFDAANSKEKPAMFSPWYSIIEITYYLNKDFIP